MIEALICFVVAVTDGDTLKVRCGNEGAYQQVTIRLAEIDAPESKQPYGRASKEALSDMCFKQQATIKPQTTDRYGRTIARVTCNGMDASTNQVQIGLAWAYTKYLTDQRIKRLESEAKDFKRGLWQDPSAVPPWEWRKERRLMFTPQ